MRKTIYIILLLVGLSLLAIQQGCDPNDVLEQLRPYVPSGDEF